MTHMAYAIESCIEDIQWSASTREHAAVALSDVLYRVVPDNVIRS